MDKSKEKCIPRSQQITMAACETSIEEKANLVCTDLLKNPKMKNCLKMFNGDILMKNCISDYCICKNTYERTECICSGISALAKDCRFRGVMLEDGWRDWQICRKIFNIKIAHIILAVTFGQHVIHSGELRDVNIRRFLFGRKTLNSRLLEEVFI